MILMTKIRILSRKHRALDTVSPNCRTIKTKITERILTRNNQLSNFSLRMFLCEQIFNEEK